MARVVQAGQSNKIHEGCQTSPNPFVCYITKIILIGIIVAILMIGFNMLIDRFFSAQPQNPVAVVGGKIMKWMKK